MNAPGKSILKVTSILFIIFGPIAIIVNVIALAGSVVLTAVTADVEVQGAAVQGAVLIIASSIGLVAGLCNLIFGIIGLKKCSDSAKASFFVVAGIILCVLQLVSMIMLFSVPSLIGFVLPILFILGGFMNKKAISTHSAQV